MAVLQKTVAGDESGIYAYEPKTEQQSTVLEKVTAEHESFSTTTMQALTGRLKKATQNIELMGHPQPGFGTQGLVVIPAQKIHSDVNDFDAGRSDGCV